MFGEPKNKNLFLKPIMILILHQTSFFEENKNSIQKQRSNRPQVFVSSRLSFSDSFSLILSSPFSFLFSLFLCPLLWYFPSIFHIYIFSMFSLKYGLCFLNFPIISTVILTHMNPCLHTTLHSHHIHVCFHNSSPIIFQFTLIFFHFGRP